MGKEYLLDIITALIDYFPGSTNVLVSSFFAGPSLQPTFVLTGPVGNRLFSGWTKEIIFSAPPSRVYLLGGGRRPKILDLPNFYLTPHMNFLTLKEGLTAFSF